MQVTQRQQVNEREKGKGKRFDLRFYSILMREIV